MQQSFLFQTRPEPIRESERSSESIEAEAEVDAPPLDAPPTPPEGGEPAPARDDPAEAPAPPARTASPAEADEDEVATAVPPAADLSPAAPEAPADESVVAPEPAEAAEPAAEAAPPPEAAAEAAPPPEAAAEAAPPPEDAAEAAPPHIAPDEPADEPEPATAPSGAEPPPPGDAEPPGGGGGSLNPGEVSLLDAARQRYLNYALSVITARALPDVRDGVKPVQRRILYAMYANLHLVHTGRFRKSAAVVGEVMARFHPHGDQSIYDAMVRLSQPFSLRAPLVDGHGNFGSLDGDPPAAMRYTECRLRALAAEMVKEIGQDTVPFRANYDGTTEEPVVLPTRIPNLLVNGVTGIAVGMATNIPPHNLTEVCRAAVALIDTPEADTAALLEHMEGPDFPMGGEILNSRDELIELYRTGRGAIRLRGTYHVEKHSRRRWIIVDSIPYGQNKATLVEAIGVAISEGKVPQLVDVRDESTDDIRIVLELKRGANDRVVMAWLYKNTNLRTNFHVNMTVLLPTENPEVGRPEQVGLVEVLRQFNRHRFVVVTRRFEYELAKIRERLHILRGFAILFDALDEAIAIIRGSDGKKDAASKLMARFPLDAIQTEAILELKLYRLAKMQIAAVREELARLEAEAARIEAILASEDALWGVVRSELLEVAAEHGDPRRTAIGGERDEFVFDSNAYIVERNTWVLVTRGGWIKRQGGFSDLSKVRVREGDSVGWVFRASTRSTLCFFSDRGRAYVLRADDIPQTSGYGEPVQRHFAFADGEQVIGVCSMDERNLPHYRPVEEPPDAEGDESPGDVGEDSLPPDVGIDSLPPDDDVGVDSLPSEGGLGDLAADGDDLGPVAVAVTRAGKGLIFRLRHHLDTSTKNGRRFVTLDKRFKGGDRVVAVKPLRYPDARLCLASEKGRALVFLAEELKLLQGTGKGVNAIRLGPGDAVLDWVLSPKRHLGLMVETSRGREVRISERKYGLTRRGGKGIEVIKRGSLAPILRDAVFIDPLQGGEDPEDVTDEDLDALEEDSDE